MAAPPIDTVEGRLVEPRHGTARGWQRQISTEVPWEIDDLADLRNLATVALVETDLNQGVITLHYAENCAVPGLPRLRSWLRAEQTFGAWRLASLASALCEALAEAHGESIPQLVIHPGRIAYDGKTFTLLPMLAARLPPLLAVLSGSCPDWLCFIAPEVLRSRGTGISLSSGATFSLGQVLGFLADPSASLGVEDNFKTAERIVESLSAKAAWKVLPGLEEFHRLARQLTTLTPSARLDLRDAAAAFRKLAQDTAPDSTIATLGPLPESELAAARAADLEQTVADGVFPIDPTFVLLARADALLTAQPADPAKALIELRGAGGYTHARPAVALREARAHARHAAEPEHLQEAAAAYARMYAINGAPDTVEQEWVSILAKMATPEEVIAATRNLEGMRAPTGIFRFRAEACMNAQKPLLAWLTIISLLSLQRFHQPLIDYCRSIAQKLSGETVTEWLIHNRDKPGMAAGVAVAWERLGNATKANEFLAKARAWMPPNSKTNQT